MTPEDSKKLFLTRYTGGGAEAFYRFILNYAVDQIVHGSDSDVSPDIGLMNQHDRFLTMYRRDNRDEYLAMARIFRRAAHKIYLLLRKQDRTHRNARFLNMVG